MLAGKEYGSGSSRDWAAKGTSLLGVKAVIAESYERIHRSNLIGMGVIPLQFPEGENASRSGCPARRRSRSPASPSSTTATTPRTVKVKADDVEFDAVVRIDTPGEANYYRNGGIMQYVLRSLLASGLTLAARLTPHAAASVRRPSLRRGCYGADRLRVRRRRRGRRTDDHDAAVDL